MSGKTYLCWLFHLYQPPTQDLGVLRRINDECYNPLFTMLEEHDNAKISLNVNGVLIDMLLEHGMEDTVEKLKNLVAENKVEILGTAKYHPILPLIPKKEAYHQIRLNEETNRKIFGNGWKGQGFFPPEMAISSKVAKIVRELNYKWVIQSGLACPADWPYDRIYTSPNGLQLFFRDDILSNKISFKKTTAKEFVQDVKTMYRENQKDTNKKKDIYLIMAMDGETFGHHIRNYERTFLGKAFELISKEEQIEIEFISKLDQHFPISEKRIIPRESSWSTTYNDIKAEVPYPLWKHPDNDVHKYYWKIMRSLNNLMKLVDNLDLTENWEIENHYNTARYFYDQALHSCPVWWSNPHRGTWSPNLIYKGVELLIRSALNAQLCLVYAQKEEGDGYFDSITYYHGLLLMELYSNTKKLVKKC